MYNSCRLPKYEGEDHREEKSNDHTIQKISNSPTQYKYSQHYPDTELTANMDSEMYPHDEDSAPHDIENDLLRHTLYANGEWRTENSLLGRDSFLRLPSGQD